MYGNNNAFVEASIRIHERWLEVYIESTARVDEAVFAGENTDMKIVVVGFPSQDRHAKNSICFTPVSSLLHSIPGLCTNIHWLHKQCRLTNPGLSKCSV